MAWKVIEYMDMNPQATPKDVLAHFAEVLEVDDNIIHVNKEVDKVLEVRDQLRPLYAKKMDAEQHLALLNGDFDAKVMIKFPPRQGSEKDRKAYKQELQKESEVFNDLSDKLNRLKDEVEVLEADMEDIQQRAKNGRRVLETFNGYMMFLLNVQNQPATASIDSAPSNHNAF
ncbi:hypothetical protein AAXE64_27105 [Priestia megaterium]